jgi:hypothetical protein
MVDSANKVWSTWQKLLITIIKGKPVEKQGRKTSGLRAFADGSGVTVYRKGECIQFFHARCDIVMRVAWYCFGRGCLLYLSA